MGRFGDVFASHRCPSDLMAGDRDEAATVLTRALGVADDALPAETRAGGVFRTNAHRHRTRCGTCAGAARQRLYPATLPGNTTGRRCRSPDCRRRVRPARPRRLACGRIRRCTHRAFPAPRIGQCRVPRVGLPVPGVRPCISERGDRALVVREHRRTAAADGDFRALPVQPLRSLERASAADTLPGSRTTCQSPWLQEREATGPVQAAPRTVHGLKFEGSEHIPPPTDVDRPDDVQASEASAKANAAATPVRERRMAIRQDQQRPCPFSATEVAPFRPPTDERTDHTRHFRQRCGRGRRAWPRPGPIEPQASDSRAGNTVEQLLESHRRLGDPGGLFSSAWRTSCQVDRRRDPPSRLVHTEPVEDRAARLGRRLGCSLRARPLHRELGLDLAGDARDRAARVQGATGAVTRCRSVSDEPYTNAMIC